MPEIDDIKWGPNNVDLICVNVTKEQEIKRIIAFFEILGVEQVGSGIFENLYNLGFTTIKDILNLTIKDLEVNVGTKPILHGLNLTIKPGEVHAIMGKNGSGKTNQIFNRSA